MTREKERREASIEYQLSTCPKAISGDAFADIARAMNVNPSFIAGAKWADKTMIEKACKWLENNIHDYYSVGDGGDEFKGYFDQMIVDFKKAMEE